MLKTQATFAFDRNGIARLDNQPPRCHVCNGILRVEDFTPATAQPLPPPEQLAAGTYLVRCAWCLREG
jgi:hypothetical protein